MTETPTLLTVKQFAAKHAAFTEASLRWLRFNEEVNGFKPAFRTVGRRLLIREDDFFRIIDEQNQVPGSVQ